MVVGLCYSFQKRETLSRIAWVFALASVLTLMLAPLCTRMERKGLSPSASAAICVLGLVLLTATALSAFIPYLFAHTMDLIRRIMPTLSTLNQQCAVFLNALGPVSYTHLDVYKRQKQKRVIDSKREKPGECCQKDE